MLACGNDDGPAGHLIPAWASRSMPNLPSTQYLVDQRCQAARAPASRPQDILREEFWRVDPERTGLVSLEQFLQVLGSGRDANEQWEGAGQWEGEGEG